LSRRRRLTNKPLLRLLITVIQVIEIRKSPQAVFSAERGEDGHGGHSLCGQPMLFPGQDYFRFGGRVRKPVVTRSRLLVMPNVRVSQSSGGRLNVIMGVYGRAEFFLESEQ
jgi:hypothetical protein